MYALLYILKYEVIFERTLNVARMGKFSSNRTIGEYAREMWGV